MFLGRRKKGCHKVQPLLSEYIDNRMDFEGRAAVERHIETCDSCRKELESLQMTVGLLNQMRSIPVPRSFVVRESDVAEDRGTESRRWGGLRPVPVMVTSHVDTGRLSIFDPQRLRWLRPATAVVAAAFVLIMMLDFLQVVPHGGGVDVRNGFLESAPQVTASPAPGEGEGTFGLEGDEVPAPIPPPVPLPGEKHAEDDAGSGEQGLRAPSEVGILEETDGGWPMRQIEIALGTLVFILVATMLFARRLRHKLIKV